MVAPAGEVLSFSSGLLLAPHLLVGEFCCNTIVLTEAGACILKKYCFNLGALLFAKFGGMGVEKVNGNDGRGKAL